MTGLEPSLAFGVAFGVLATISVLVAIAAQARARRAEAACRASEERYQQLANERAHPAPVLTRAGGRAAMTPGDLVAEAGGVDVAAPESLAPATGPADPRVASVLVVEDEPGVRALIKLVLTRSGHDVSVVAGPHDALAALIRQPSIELVLVDVVLPDMSGYDLAVQARKLVPNLRIVFMSGFAHDPTRHSPGDGFLHKPFRVESLQEVVQQALTASPTMAVTPR